ncbi:Swarming motility protein YbiA [Balamuthia mandrillaris]
MEDEGGGAAAPIFYSGEEASGEYGAFSNRAAFAFELDGKRWPTVEHFFHAQKFAGTDHEEAIRNAKNANSAHRMGRDRSRPLRGDWEQVKEQVAERGIRAKFQQHSELRRLLLSTGDRPLVQRTRNDDYWGDSGKANDRGGVRGQNVMGHILMKVRASLIEEAEAEAEK